MDYLRLLAERIKAEVPDEVLPEGDTSLLFLLYAVLARAKGHAVTREDVHDAWVAWMAAQGEEHESMCEFHRLDPSVQAEDSPFVVAIRRVAAHQPSA